MSRLFMCVSVYVYVHMKIVSIVIVDRMLRFKRTLYNQQVDSYLVQVCWLSRNSLA